MKWTSPPGKKHYNVSAKNKTHWFKNNEYDNKNYHPKQIKQAAQHGPQRTTPS